MILDVIRGVEHSFLNESAMRNFLRPYGVVEIEQGDHPDCFLLLDEQGSIVGEAVIGINKVIKLKVL